MSKRLISLPSWYGDHMLFQQEVRTRIYGTTTPGANVTLTLERFPSRRLLSSLDVEYGIIFQENDIAEKDGFFAFKLPLIEGSYDTFRLTVESSGERHVFEDILFGELWLALGGSNMAMPVQLSDMQPLLNTLHDDGSLRFFTSLENGLLPGHSDYAYEPQAKLMGGRWFKPSDRESLRLFSAVGLSFALELASQRHLPVGVIAVPCRRSCIHSWLPRAVIEKDSIIKNHVREIRHYRDREHWNVLPQEEKKAEQLIRSHRKQQEPRDEAAAPPPFSKMNQPGALFNHKLAPLVSLGLRGILWYQGEEDVQYPEAYERSFIALSEVFREMFQAPLSGLSLVYSQLTPLYASRLDASRLAVFNEALTAARRKLALPAAMITNYDLPLTYPHAGDSYSHLGTPMAKREIGRRMCQVALGLAYHMDCPSSAPECMGAETVGSKLLLTFSNAGKGIRLRGNAQTSKGFTICDAEHPYIQAEAKALFQVRVIVWHDAIREPQSCAYAFSNFNQEANLCGSDGMPLVPFRLSRDNFVQEKPHEWSACDALQGFRIPCPDPHSPRLRGRDEPGLYPLWRISQGRGRFTLERENKRHGEASLLIHYSKADERPLHFGPVLSYASSYPPLDLHIWRELVCHVFNTDHRRKTLRLELADQNGQKILSEPEEILDQLSWQEIHFSLDNAPVDLQRLTEVEWILQDPEASGSLYLDEISFHELN